MSAIFSDYTPPNRMICPACEQREGGGGWIVHKRGCQLGPLENRRRAVTAHVVVIEFPGPELCKGAWEAITAYAKGQLRGRGQTAGWYRILTRAGLWVVVIVGESMRPIRQLVAVANGFGGRVDGSPLPSLIAAARTRRWRCVVDATISGDTQGIEIRDRPSQVDELGNLHRVTGGQG